MVRVFNKHLAADAIDGTKHITNGSIPTAALADGAVTKAKIGLKAVDVTVSAGNNSATTSADSDLVNGQIIGILPAGNQDQFIDDVTLNADGSIIVTLAANATADNTFTVIVLKP